jgi:hypothetical protein
MVGRLTGIQSALNSVLNQILIFYCPAQRFLIVPHLCKICLLHVYHDFVEQRYDRTVTILMHINFFTRVLKVFHVFAFCITVTHSVFCGTYVLLFTYCSFLCNTATRHKPNCSW